MATFPIKQSEVTTLATTMIGGFSNNTSVFPAPPIAPAALQTALGEFNTADTDATQAQAVAQQKTTVKAAKRKTLTGVEESFMRRPMKDSSTPFFADTKNSGRNDNLGSGKIGFMAQIQRG